MRSHQQDVRALRGAARRARPRRCWCVDRRGVRAGGRGDPRLLGKITRYLHGEITRADLDRAAVKAWLGKGSAVARSLVTSTSGPSWEPDDPRTAELALTGIRPRGGHQCRERRLRQHTHFAAVGLTVTVPTAGGATQQLRKLTIAVVKAPRVGDRVEVAYDAADPHRFVYRPLIDQWSTSSSTGP